MLKAVIKNGYRIQYANDSLIQDQKFMLDAIGQTTDLRNLLLSIPTPLKSNKDFMLEAIKCLRQFKLMLEQNRNFRFHAWIDREVLPGSLAKSGSTKTMTPCTFALR